MEQDNARVRGYGYVVSMQVERWSGYSGANMCSPPVFSLMRENKQEAKIVTDNPII